MAAQNTNPINASLAARTQQMSRLAQRNYKNFQQYRSNNPGRFDPYIDAVARPAAKGAARGVNAFNQALINDPKLVNEWLNHGVNAFNTVSSTVWQGGPNGLFTGTQEFGPKSVQPSRVPLSEAPQLDELKLVGGTVPGKKKDGAPDPGQVPPQGPLPPVIGGAPWEPRPGQQPNPGPGGPPSGPPGDEPPAPPTGPDDEDPGPPSVGPFDNWPPRTEDPGPRTVGPFDNWNPVRQPGSPAAQAPYPTVDPATGRVTTPDPGVPEARLTLGPPGAPAPGRAPMKPGDVPTVDPISGKVSMPPQAKKPKPRYGGPRPYDPGRPRPQAGPQQIDGLLAPLSPEQQEGARANAEMLRDLDRPADGAARRPLPRPPRNYRRPKND